MDTFVGNYDRKRVHIERKGAIPFHLVSCQDASPVLMLVGVWNFWGQDKLSCWTVKESFSYFHDTDGHGGSL